MQKELARTSDTGRYPKRLGPPPSATPDFRMLQMMGIRDTGAPYSELKRELVEDWGEEHARMVLVEIARLRSPRCHTARTPPRPFVLRRLPCIRTARPIGARTRTTKKAASATADPDGEPPGRRASFARGGGR